MTSAPSTRPASANPSAPSNRPAPELQHGCVRCGAPIPMSEAMCERCNPLGLKQPSASQAHGTVFAGIGVAVVIMAVVARFATAGVGPFSGGVANVTAAPGGLEVSLSVRNEGTNAGATTCRIGDPRIPGIGPETAYITSPVIQPGATASFAVVISSLGTEVTPLTAVCGS